MATFTPKQKEAAAAIAAANPTWSQRHVDMCASFLMPTSNEHYFDPGTPERIAAEQHHRERMHEFLVEMNILSPDKAYKRPANWQSPYKAEKLAVTRQRAAPAPRPAAEPSATGEPKAAPVRPLTPAEIKEPRPGSAGAQAWAVCDQLFEALGRLPSGAEAGEAGAAAGLNPGNVRAEISRWAKFRGHRK